MSTAIGSLHAILSANTVRFDQGMRAAAGRLGAFRGSVIATTSTLGGLATQLVGIGGLAAAGYGFISLAKAQFGARDATAKLSDELKIAPDRLLGITHAADLAGQSSETVAQSMRYLGRTLGDALTGRSKESEKSFAALGLSAKALSAMPLDRAFLEVSEALRRVESPSIRASAAMGIFGRAGMQASAFLALGRDEIERLIAESNRLGGAFSRLDLGRIEEANDAISRMKTALANTATEAVVRWAPKITHGAHVIAAAVRSIGPAWDSLSERQQRSLQTWLAGGVAFAAAWKTGVVGAVLKATYSMGVLMAGAFTAIDARSIASARMALAPAVALAKVGGILAVAFGGFKVGRAFGEAFDFSPVVERVWTWGKWFIESMSGYFTGSLVLAESFVKDMAAVLKGDTSFAGTKAAGAAIIQTQQEAFDKAMSEQAAWKEQDALAPASGGWGAFADNLKREFSLGGIKDDLAGLFGALAPDSAMAFWDKFQTETNRLAAELDASAAGKGAADTAAGARSFGWLPGHKRGGPNLPAMQWGTANAIQVTRPAGVEKGTVAAYSASLAADASKSGVNKLLAVNERQARASEAALVKLADLIDATEDNAFEEVAI
ncbi:MAG: hypothetical protein KBA18_09485 [Kiritimatiellae bacterium]|nr:hypothetical protein [Kiritimatiellia bacterium]